MTCLSTQKAFTLRKLARVCEMLSRTTAKALLTRLKLDAVGVANSERVIRATAVGATDSNG